MVFLETKPQQGSSASTSDVSPAGKTPLIGPSQSQRPLKTDAAKAAEKSNETEGEYMERKIREVEEKDRIFEEDQKNPMAKQEAKKRRLARPSNSQQNVNKPQTGTSAGALSKPASGDFWDGFITDQPPFRLSELIALKPCSFSAHFYAYARRNGRTGVIKTDLIEDLLENSPKIPLDDTAMMSAVQPEPKADKVESEAKGQKSKGRRKPREEKNPRAATTQQAAADSDPAAEAEITGQTFEQVCEELKTYIEEMDTSWSTESEMQQARFCLETIRAVTEKVKELGKHSLAPHHTARAVSPSPSAIDPESKKRELGKKNPPLPILAAKSLTDVKTGHFEVYEEKTAIKYKGLQQSRQDWKKRAGELADDDSQGFMSYSEAAKAAARYYALTSAYGKLF